MNAKKPYKKKQREIIFFLSLFFTSVAYSNDFYHNIGVCLTKTPFISEKGVEKDSFCEERESFSILKINRIIKDGRLENQYLVETKTGKRGWLRDKDLIINDYAAILKPRYADKNTLSAVYTFPVDLNGDGKNDWFWIGYKTADEEYPYGYQTIFAKINNQIYLLPSEQAALAFSLEEKDIQIWGFQKKPTQKGDLLLLTLYINEKEKNPYKKTITIGWKNNRLIVLK